MTRMIKRVVTTVLGLGLACASADALAGNFLRTSGVVLDLQGNAVNADGSITIGSKGLIVRRADNTALIPQQSAENAMTIIAEVEDIPTPAASGSLVTLLGVFDGGTTLDVNADGKYEIGWGRNDASWAHAISTTDVSSGKHRIAIAYRNSSGGAIIVDGVRLAKNSAYSSSGAITKVHIGQYYKDSTSTCVATGLKVTRVAVEDREMTAAEVAAYDWTAEPPRYAKFAADFFGRIVTATSYGEMQDGNFRARANINPILDCEMVVATEYVGSTSYTDFPGYTGDAQPFWHGFCNSFTAVTGYVAPGLVLRIPPNTSANAYQVKGAFGIALGGLIVEADASKDGKLARICERNGTDNRAVVFGDTAGVKETYFEIADDFTVCRRGALNLYGPVNFNVVEGKTFACTSEVAATKIMLTTGAALRMHGAGTLKTPSVTAASATLDYTGLDLSRTAPFIDGDLVLDGKTRFAFPAGLAANTPYALCSGSVTGIAQTQPDAVIRVGDVEKIVKLAFDGNTVSYSESVAVARVDGVEYDSAQDALDAAGPTSTIEFLAEADVSLAADKTLKQVSCLADVTIAGAGTLTLSDAGGVSVAEGKALTVDASVLIGGEVVKTGKGTVAFNAAFGRAETADAGTFAVVEGGAAFDGAISGVTVCGRGTDALEVNWPVITLCANCTAVIGDGCNVTPAYSAYATVTADSACYGKIVHNGATITSAKGWDMMYPNGGGAKYVLNSGSIDLGSNNLSLQWKAADVAKFTFEQNGGTLTAAKLSLCRTWISSNKSECYQYILNGGTLNAWVSSADNEGRDPTHFADKIRLELNGGTYNVSGYNPSDYVFAPIGKYNLVFGGGEVTIIDTNERNDVVLGMVSGTIGKVAFSGGAAFDFSSVTGLAAGDVEITSGTAVLGDCMLNADSTLVIAKGAKAGLAFEGTKEVKAMSLGGREAVKDRVYGAGGAYFIVTEQGGRVCPTTGRDADGLLLLLK